MGTKIFWVSRHPPLPVQIKWLENRFGQVEIQRDSRTFSNAQQIKERFEHSGADELVVVAPLWVIYHLTELAIKPLWAQMKEVRSLVECDLAYNDRFYRFVEFRRIVGMEIKFEQV